MWDTFEFFESLLNDFTRLLTEASTLPFEQAGDSFGVKVAVVGFMLNQPQAVWEQEDTDFIAARLAGELSLEEMDWFEECAEAVSLFSCLVLGGIIGLFKQEQIDQTGFLLGDAHLAAFNAENSNAMYSRFNAYKSE